MTTLSLSLSVCVCVSHSVHHARDDEILIASPTRTGGAATRGFPPKTCKKKKKKEPQDAGFFSEILVGCLRR